MRVVRQVGKDANGIPRHPEVRERDRVELFMQILRLHRSGRAADERHSGPGRGAPPVGQGGGGHVKRSREIIPLYC